MSDELLVPLDGSELAEAALPWAALLARREDLSLVLLRATPFPPYFAAVLEGDRREELLAPEQAATHEYLARVGQWLTDQGVHVETVVREGEPADVIRDLAKGRGPMGIVMATHGHGGLSRLVLGSVAARVAGETTTPLLLVHAQPSVARGAPALSRILVPVDGSALAEGALPWARSLLPAGGTLILTRIVSDHDEAPRSEARAEAEIYLARLAGAERPADGTVETVVRVGRPSEAIRAAARETQADLIVLATHGRTGLQRALLGSVADAVLREADVPVLLTSARALATRRNDEFPGHIRNGATTPQGIGASPS